MFDSEIDLVADVERLALWDRDKFGLRVRPFPTMDKSGYDLTRRLSCARALIGCCWLSLSSSITCGLCRWPYWRLRLMLGGWVMVLHCTGLLVLSGLLLGPGVV